MILPYDFCNEVIQQQEQQKLDAERLQEGLKKLDAVFANYHTKYP